MGFLKLIDSISTENLNEKEEAKFIDRKQALSKMSDYTKKMAISAIPLGALTMITSKPATAESSGPSDVDILNYALTLEYLEADFYNKGLNSGVIPGSDEAIFKQISKHEDDHVTFLKDALGSKAVSKPQFDFTAGGNFDPFNNNGTGQQKAYAQFQILSQGFEDTGVRGYKGQAANLDNKDTLGAALRIHSVEARHASEVRRLRGQQGWILGDGKNAPSPISAVYASGSTYKLGEGNTAQAGVDVSQFISSDAASESFDEPLGMDAVSNGSSGIADPFIQ